MDPHRLTLTGYPAIQRWELTADATGLIVASGSYPIDRTAVRAACAAFHEGVDAAMQTATVTGD